MGVLFGILVIILGAGIACLGLPLYLTLLPLSGFFVGLFGGAAAISSAFDAGFLATAFGILGGLAMGAVFALAAFFYWYLGALLAVGMAGFVFGAALFGAFGINSDWLLFVLAFAVAVLFFVVALFMNIPVYIVIIGTALFGSAIAIGGLLVIFGPVDSTAVTAADTWRKIQDNPLLWLLWGVGAGVGAFAQSTMISKVELPEQKWSSAARKRA